MSKKSEAAGCFQHLWVRLLEKNSDYREKSALNLGTSLSLRLAGTETLVHCSLEDLVCSITEMLYCPPAFLLQSLTPSIISFNVGFAG